MERILELEDSIFRLTSYVYNINYEKYKKIIIVFGNGGEHSLYINNQSLLINPGEVIGYLGYDFKQKIYPIGENDQILSIKKPTKGSSLKHKQIYKDYEEDEEIIELIYIG
jgi:predicted phosphodiesterase